jgi:hypothetical protein
MRNWVHRSGSRSAPKVLGAIVAGAALLLTSSIASAAPLVWVVDPAQSSISLNVPDQVVVAGDTSITIRFRDAGNASTWNQGRTAPVTGTLVTNYVDGSSIEFLGGAHDVYALTTGSFRPDPAAFDPIAGVYVGTTTAPAIYAARVRATVSLLSVDVGFVSFLDVRYDVLSGVLPIDGSGSFAANALTIGLADALLAFDGLNVSPLELPVPDAPPTPVGPLLGTNAVASALVTAPDPIGDPLLRRLTIAVNVPFELDLLGTPLNASASGILVAYAYLVPEPGTLVLLAFGLAGLAIVRRERA